MNNLKLDSKTLLPIIIIVVIVAGAFILGRMRESNSTPDPTPNPQAQDAGNAPQIGRVVVAENVDRDSCPVNVTSTLNSNTQAFYVVAEDSYIPSGTDFFVRLYHDGVAVEDSPLATADQDYDNVCIYAVFETTRFSFTPGEYEAEFIVRGNPVDSVQFRVQ